MVLGSCQLLEGDSAPAAGTPEALQGRPQVSLVYPDLHTVPPLPQLSYPIEQRREIVERLISDRELARYTQQQIRFEAGISSLPPPPQPPAGALQAVAAQQAARIVAPGGERLFEPEAEPAPEDEDAAVLDDDYDVWDDDSDSDDNSLNDFMRDFMRETAPPEASPEGTVDPSGPQSEGGEQSSAREREVPSGATASSASDEKSALADQLLGWIGDLFGSEGTAALEGEVLPANGAGTPRPAAKPVPIASPAVPAAKPNLTAFRTGVVPPETIGKVLGSIAFAPGSHTLAGDAVTVLAGAAAAAGEGGWIEVRATAEDRALAIDRGRAVALALMESGVGLAQIELLVDDGPDEARLVLARRAS